METDFLSSFGRRMGRGLSDHQQSLYDAIMPEIGLNLPQAGQALDMKWGDFKPQSLRMEIGFGAGEHLAAQAAANPQVGFIGCEPFINGVGKLLVTIEQQKLQNIRLFTDDARLLMAHLPDGCLSEAYILFPDPWPKTRHHKRRLVNAALLAELARLQPVGGRLLLATDHVDYGSWMLEHVQTSEHYDWMAECEADWSTPPADWTATRYQRKTSAEGRDPLFIECRRI